MPLQNRVNPCGQIEAVTSRGTFMGNRGVLHNGHKEIVRLWKVKRWITCAIDHSNIRRTLMAPGAYTELFFLDEPTSYAAGHRPCSTCRNAQFKAFKAAWMSVFPECAPTTDAIDRTLHTARLLDNGSQRAWLSRLRELPNGTLISQLGRRILLWDSQQWTWSYSGYVLTVEPVGNDEEVEVLTPEPIVRLFSAGLSQSLQVHPTALGATYP
jgi:hypothetical protein